MRLRRRVGRVAAGLGLLWFVTWLGILATSWLWPRDAPLPEAADAIICLGGSMSYQGWERPGPASTRRARTCAELAQAGVAPVIVFTGAGHEIMSVAEAMADLARSDGVAEAAIIIEPEAHSTLQNAAFALAHLPADIDRVVVVSDAFHLPRSWLIFQLLGSAEVDLYAARMRYTVEDGPEARSQLDWMLRESVVVWVNAARIAAYILGGVLQIDEEVRISWFG